MGHSRARVCVWHAAGAHDRREASFPDNLALGCVFTKAKSKDPGRHLARRTTAPKQTIFALKGAGEPTNHSFMSPTPFAAVHSEVTMQCSFKPNHHSAIRSGTFSTEQTRVAPMGLNSTSRPRFELGEPTSTDKRCQGEFTLFWGIPLRHACQTASQGSQ